MRISDWSSDVCSSDLAALRVGAGVRYIGDTESTGAAMTLDTPSYTIVDALVALDWDRWTLAVNATNLFDKTYYAPCRAFGDCFTGNRRYAVGSLSYRFRSEEHTSELQPLMRISYAVFCLKKKNYHTLNTHT